MATAFRKAFVGLLLLLACSRPAPAARLVVEVVRTQTRPDWPAYRVVVHDDGRVLYEGGASVATRGQRNRGASPTVLARIRHQLGESGVFGLAKDCCDGPWNLTGQEVRLTAVAGGRTTTARFPYVPGDQGPSGRLSRLADDVDGALGIRSLVTPLPASRGLE